MALYAPVALLALPTVSLALVFAGFTVAFFGLDHDGWRDAMTTSGSCLLTLGFERPPTTPGVLLGFLEALIGLGLLALVIAYLPTIYGAFSRREVAVTDLSVRAGTPPKPWEMLERAHLAGYLNELDAVWADLDGRGSPSCPRPTRRSASLSFFRSPNPHRSWITAAGAVLDSAALRLAVARTSRSRRRPGLCIRSGYLALREIAGVLRLRVRPRPEARRADLDHT